MRKSNLIAFGFYCETVPQLRRKLPSIKEAEFLDTVHPLKAKILRYLEEGEINGEAFGCNVYDPFTKPPTKLTTNIPMLTDGVWIWPSFITYFINQYDLSLPDKLIEHMQNNDWRVPKVFEDSLEDSSEEYQEVIRSKEEIEAIPVPRTFFEYFPRQWNEFADLFVDCSSFEHCYEICQSCVSQIIELFQLDALDARGRFLLSDMLMNEPVPPKFVGPNCDKASREQIAEARETLFISLLDSDQQLPLSWNTEEYIWLERKESSWGITKEYRKEAYERYNKNL